MYIQVCDRCGRVTKEQPSFLIPCSADEGTYRVENTWFGKPVILCKWCQEDFNEFRYEHKTFNEQNKLYSDFDYDGRHEKIKAPTFV